MFLLRKTVDWSLLHEGFSIPVKQQYLWKTLPGVSLNFGEERKIKFVIGDKEFDGITLKNQAFSKKDYPDHSDVVQVRYSPNSEFAKYLRAIYDSSYNLIKADRESKGGKSKGGTKLSEQDLEFISFSSTTLPDVFVVDIETVEERSIASTINQYFTEEEFENETSISALKDSGAGFKYKEGIKKIRDIDRNIGDSLKLLYDYTCQMTGEKIGLEYDANVVEAHHIEPFTQSLNNDASNIIILSPTYHRIVHKTKAEFDHKSLSYKFPNGLVEKVKVNKHL